MPYTDADEAHRLLSRPPKTARNPWPTGCTVANAVVIPKKSAGDSEDFYGLDLHLADETIESALTTIPTFLHQPQVFPDPPPGGLPAKIIDAAVADRLYSSTLPPYRDRRDHGFRCRLRDLHNILVSASRGSELDGRQLQSLLVTQFRDICDYVEVPEKPLDISEDIPLDEGDEACRARWSRLGAAYRKDWARQRFIATLVRVSRDDDQCEYIAAIFDRAQRSDPAKTAHLYVLDCLADRDGVSTWEHRAGRLAREWSGILDAMDRHYPFAVVSLPLTAKADGQDSGAIAVWTLLQALRGYTGVRLSDLTSPGTRMFGPIRFEDGPNVDERPAVVWSSRRCPRNTFNPIGNSDLRFRDWCVEQDVHGNALLHESYTWVQACLVASAAMGLGLVSHEGFEGPAMLGRIRLDLEPLVYDKPWRGLDNDQCASFLGGFLAIAPYNQQDGLGCSDRDSRLTTNRSRTKNPLWRAVQVTMYKRPSATGSN